MSNQLQETRPLSEAAEIVSDSFPASFTLALADRAHAAVKDWMIAHAAPAEIVELFSRIGNLYEASAMWPSLMPATEAGEQIKRETVFEVLNLLDAMGIAFA